MSLDARALMRLGTRAFEGLESRDVGMVDGGRVREGGAWRAGLLVLAAVLATLLGVGCGGERQTGGAASETAEAAPPGDTLDVRAMLDRAIAAHGGAVLDTATLAFRFRDARFRLTRRGGRFHYRRAHTDTLGRRIVEGLTNGGVYRVVAGDTVALTDSARAAVATRVNSVAYFALLPYPLGDPAVQPAYAGPDTVRGQPYHRVRVTFRPQGGGADYEDVFCFWFHADSLAMDYLAYAYGLAPGETDTGTRFREAVGVRRLAPPEGAAAGPGVRVADYRNRTADTLATDAVCRYGDLVGTQALRRVSTVRLDSVRLRRPRPSDLRRSP